MVLRGSVLLGISSGLSEFCRGLDGGSVVSLPSCHGSSWRALYRVY